MKKILIVDDRYEVREILEDFLTMQGYETILANDGREGLERFKAEEPHVAIVDVEMPVMDGFELTKAIKDEKKDFPIIIITAFIKKYPKSSFTNMGVQAVLFKPLDLQTLRKELEKIFS